MPKSTPEELARLRDEVYAVAGGRCEWPGCGRPGEQMAHITHRGMGGSRIANRLDNVLWLCVRDHSTLDGRAGVMEATCRIRIAYVACRRSSSCAWPGCALPGSLLNSARRQRWSELSCPDLPAIPPDDPLCETHVQIVTEGVTKYGNLRWELNELLRVVVVRQRRLG